VASNLAPAAPSWDSLAGGTRDDSLNGAWATFKLPLAAAIEGTNLLAIQLFNNAVNSSDLLLLPEVDLVTLGRATAAYLSVPTPGMTNGSGTEVVPPTVELLSHAGRPAGGAGSPPLSVQVAVSQTLLPITNVTLFYRTMFASDATVRMILTTGSVYAAEISTSNLKPGEMLRWRIEARDAAGNIGSAPLFLAANDDDRYFGTVAQNPAEGVSRLPVLHWFVQDYSAAISQAGGRGSFFFLDRFYDNILVKLHGQSTAGFPKKSHNIDFNAGNRFTWREGEKPAKDVNLLSNWGDKSKVRNTLAYEMFQRAGLECHWAFPVRVQTNGGFHAVLDLVEDGDDRFTERVGLNPRGALYKVYVAGFSGTNIWDAEKKARRDEGNADLAAFSLGVADTWPMAQRRAYVYDNVNIAATINYLAAIVLNSCTDQGSKNFYLYRDSDGSREWRVLPWDVDLTFGHDWLSGPAYFDDHIYFQQPLQLGAINSLKEIFFDNPELNQMFLRRLRTLMDSVLQPASAPGQSFTNENRIAELLNLLDPPGVARSDADLDFSKWGWWIDGIQRISTNAAQEIRPQAQRIIDTFLPGRRAFLLSAQSSGIGLPPSQTNSPSLILEVGEFNPAGGRQEQEFVLLRNTNKFAVDISHWKLGGAITYEFPPGTIIPSMRGADPNIGVLYVARDPFGFRQRGTAPRGGQGCLVSGPYAGQLSARGESLSLEDTVHRTVASTSYPGNPSLSQRFLRITELMYHPAPLAGSATPAQEFEFIELRNISLDTVLDLQGVHFTNGLSFCFTNTTLLPPQQCLILARNPDAFVERYGNGLNVVGPVDGYLDDVSQRLTLLDAVNEEILDFTYHHEWLPLTDGLGFSLVVRDDQAAPDAWNEAAQWRSSGRAAGSPGGVDPPSSVPSIKINEILAHTDLPQLDSIELFNPTTNVVAIGGWFLTDDRDLPQKFRIPDNTSMEPMGYLIFDERRFNGQANTNRNFRISSNGDSLWLFSGDEHTNLTGYACGVEFGPTPNGVSLGRHVTSQGDEHFVIQRDLSLGRTNAGPRVGPIIIRSIMYHPPDVIANIVATDDATMEFIELFNLAATNVLGFDPAFPTNTWKISGAVSYPFPTNFLFPPEAALLLVGFNPTNAAQVDSFRARWPFSTNISIAGPWTGKLDNSADDIQLLRPDPPNLDGSVPFILIEQVQYSDRYPWPLGADGQGAALQRKAIADYANDPANWFALPPAGSNVPDSDGDGMPDWWEAQNGLDLTVNDADLDPDGDGMSNAQEFVARTDPRDFASRLNLTAARDAAGDLLFSFSAQPQVAYAIQTNVTLASGEWRTWWDISAASTNRQLRFQQSIAPGALFYRLRVQPE